MKSSEIFEGLLKNLKIDNRSAIINRRTEIVKALNKEFRGVDKSTRNQLMVGSYGRGSAIRGISDLDMLFILPASIRDAHKKADGPEKILTRTRTAIKARYPDTEVKVDRLVVVVQFQNFKFEVQPVFENEDESFSYPDTYSKSWKVTKPRAEIEAIRAKDALSKGNLRNLCKMVRAWKNAHGVVMSGLLIDTLTHNFIRDNEEYHTATPVSYGLMARDFFKFLSEEEDHEHYAALGSGQQVKVKKKFQRRAKRAYELCDAAIAAEGKTVANKKWKAVFGKPVPSAAAAAAARESVGFRDTEEFIEDRYPVDIRHTVLIDCTVSQDGFRPQKLRTMLQHRWPLRPRKKLLFAIVECEVPEPYKVKWKVLNRGPEAERLDRVRGQIIDPNQSRARGEETNFRGDHYVECYVIKNGVVVARSRIQVPIEPEQ
ncbi:nucleotidyltransferase [Lentzea guizhouensis]|uniref:Nucleotidyltransferase n=1 Tax=Lentzea guizhouensis TaxID=1586287 RepID=A0A1B2HPI5_9PSEU|nr:nucleotidyltransferase [Lentzea guizhouensis]ANZ39634.1 nucleotidyltransferase [Lentzea guizhouensis]